MLCLRFDPSQIFNSSQEILSLIGNVIRSSSLTLRQRQPEPDRRADRRSCELSGSFPRSSSWCAFSLRPPSSLPPSGRLPLCSHLFLCCVMCCVRSSGVASENVGSPDQSVGRSIDLYPAQNPLLNREEERDEFMNTAIL